MNTDQQERAAYQRAVETAKNEIADLRRRTEMAEALARELQQQRDQAEQDAAALRRSMSIMQDDHRRVLALLNQAEADRAALREHMIAYLTSATIEDRERLRIRMYGIAADVRPGAALLAELQAARDLIGLFRAHYEAGGEVPGSFPVRLAAYDAAVKARAE